MKNKKSVLNNQSGLAHLGIGMLIVTVLIAVGATGYYVYSKNRDTKSSLNQQQSDSIDTIESLPNDLLSVDKIKELTDKENAGSIITGIQLETESGKLIYLVRLSDGNNLLFNAQTGLKVTGISVDKDGDSTDDLPANFNVTVDISKAYDLAMAQNPNGIIKQIELESEDGKVVYNVKFTDGSKVIINANDGLVVKVKKKSDKSSTSGSSGKKESENNDSADDNGKDSADDLTSDSESSSQKSGSDSKDDSNDDKSGSSNSGSHSSDSNSDSDSGSHSGSDN